MDEQHRVPLPEDLSGTDAHPARPRLTRLGRDLRGDLDPERWRAADRQARIAMALKSHAAICRCLRLWVPELVFEPPTIGPLVRRDPLTDRIVGTRLLVDDPDPRGLLRALVQQNCDRARERLVRNSRWFHFSPLQRLRQRLRRGRRRPVEGGGGTPELDVLDLEPAAAARQVLDGYRQGR